KGACSREANFTVEDCESYNAITNGTCDEQACAVAPPIPNLGALPAAHSVTDRALDDETSRAERRTLQDHALRRRGQTRIRTAACLNSAPRRPGRESTCTRRGGARGVTTARETASPAPRPAHTVASGPQVGSRRATHAGRCGRSTLLKASRTMSAQ